MSLTTTDVVDLAEAARLARTGEGRAIREEAGVPQTAVASAVRVSASAVSRWEAGDRVPTGKAGVRWVRLLRRLRDDAHAGADS